MKINEMVERKICPVCGKRFYAPPSQIKRLKIGAVLTCSKKCSGITRSGKANHNWKEKTKKTCPVCERVFEVIPSLEHKRKYCSSDCRQKVSKQQKLPKRSDPNWRPYNWKGGGVERKCEYCGKVFIAKHAAVKKGQARFCSRRCWSGAIVKTRAGKQYNNARGGKREDLENKYFRSSWEANYARYLNWLISIGEIVKWEFEPDTFEFNGIKKGTRFYTPDFKVFDKNGNHEYHEIKGYMDNRSKTKLKRMNKYYPNVRVVLIDAESYRAIARQVKGIIRNWESNGHKEQ